MTELAPARCARHSDSASIALCARCGDLVCADCWVVAQGLCEPCAKRDPFYHVAVLPWEDASLGPWARVWGTLSALLRPWSRASAFARGDIGQATAFAMLFSLPLSCLSTLIPLTHTLLFAPTLTIQLIGHPSPQAIIWDVLRALVLGPVVTLLMLVPTLLGLWSGSLLRTPKVWLRAVLYWSWLPPSLLLATYVPVWVALQAGWLGIAIWPLVVVWWVAQGYIARRAALLSWPRTLLTLWSASLASLLGFALGAGLLAWLAPAAPQ